MEAVSELTHNKTVIMIAHRLKTVRNADRISVVEHGEIVQQGAHDELVAAQRWIAKATTTVNIPQNTGQLLFSDTLRQYPYSAPLP